MKEKKNSIELAMEAQQPTAQEQPTVQEQPKLDSEVAAIANELYALIESDGLPEGFDLETACQDVGFMELTQEYGLAAAVRIYDAERRAAEAEKNAMTRINQQMQQRKGLPKSMSGGGYAAPKADYANMDSKAFRRLSEELRRSAREGKRIPL